MVAQLQHVCFVVADLDVSRRFYLDVLGFEEIIRPSDFAFPGAYVRLGEAEIHLVLEARPGLLRGFPPGWDAEELQTGFVHHVGVMVDSLDPFLEALQAHGLERAGGFRVRDDFVEQVYVADPDGNIIELLQQLDPEIGRRRRQQIYDEGLAVPVAPGYPLVDPRQRYGDPDQ